MPRLLSKIGFLCLAGFLLASSQVFATDDFGLDAGPKSSKKSQNSDQIDDPFLEMEETAITDFICNEILNGENEKYKDWNMKVNGKKWTAVVAGNKDPFEPRIVKKIIQAAPPPKAQVVKPVEKPKPAAPPVKPIKLTVSGIVGNEGSRLAIVKFENDELTITKDQIVEGKFKVVDIYADRVVVYSNKEQRRHTFKIGGEEAK